MCIGAASLGLRSAISDFKIKTESDLQNLNNCLEIFINEVQDSFFNHMTDVKSIAKYISKYDYENNLKVLVGGHFPVHNFKKMFLLYEGGQIDRYTEYKEGLLKQIESFPSRKPKRKEEAIHFMDNFNHLINELEARDCIKPTVY